MDKETQTREWIYALAASKLTGGNIQGASPSLLEIDQWRLGKLVTPRSDEVLSHVAHDEACFTQWRELCEAQRWLATEAAGAQSGFEEQPLPSGAPVVQTTGGWLGGIAARLSTLSVSSWGGAIAAGLFALLVIPAMFRPGDDGVAQAYLQQLNAADHVLGAELPTTLSRLTKSISTLDQLGDDDRRQFQQGLAAVADRVDVQADERWAAWRAGLPAAVDCAASDSGDCSAKAVRNQALGSWSLVTALACGTDTTDAAFWSQQGAALNDIAAAGVAADHFLVARLQAPLPQVQADICVLANGLLGQGG